MGKKEKLIKRFKTMPSDFTFDEAEAMFGYFGYWVENRGKTSGSRVKFINKDNRVFFLHRPHPSSVLKGYQIKQIKHHLEMEGLL